MVISEAAVTRMVMSDAATPDNVRFSVPRNPESSLSLGSRRHRTHNRGLGQPDPAQT
jgi:hypothetical protein